MATLSLSPTPGHISAMSSRRGPLTNNPNVANSPLRGVSALAGYAKQKRSYATVQREETYGQPPPLKKQVLDNGVQRPVRSPSRSTRTQVLVQRGTTRPSTKERSARTVPTNVARDMDNERKHGRDIIVPSFPRWFFTLRVYPMTFVRG
jgi:regulatory subunit for Cdc7p protein kinase